MSELESLIRGIVRSELEVWVSEVATRQPAVSEAGVTQPVAEPAPSQLAISGWLAEKSPRKRKSRPTRREPGAPLTPGQKAARTRKWRAAGYKAWQTRIRNRALGPR